LIRGREKGYRRGASPLFDSSYSGLIICGCLRGAEVSKKYPSTLARQGYG